jgi:hypothetical protein
MEIDTVTRKLAKFANDWLPLELPEKAALENQSSLTVELLIIGPTFGQCRLSSPPPDERRDRGLQRQGKLVIRRVSTSSY